MSGEELEKSQRGLSVFSTVFTAVGAFIAITASAWLITYIVVELNRWGRYWESIFGLAWGLCARLFHWSVRKGISTNLNSRDAVSQKEKALKEQLLMLRVVDRLINWELAASVLLLVTQLLTAK